MNRAHAAVVRPDASVLVEVSLDDASPWAVAAVLREAVAHFASACTPDARALLVAVAVVPGLADAVEVPALVAAWREAVADSPAARAQLSTFDQADVLATDLEGRALGVAPLLEVAATERPAPSPSRRRARRPRRDPRSDRRRHRRR